MESESMDDLSDGVNKLQEFSSVLSSVTRALDKNVRRLEDQFGKANTALKDMKVTVDENKEATFQLRKENDEQLSALQDAVKAASTIKVGTLQPSEFMLDSRALTDTRTASIIAQEEKDRIEEESTSGKQIADHHHKSWSHLINDVTSLAQRQTGLSVNESLHHMNKTLKKPKILTPEEEVELKKKSPAEQQKAIAAAKEAAPFPFPELKEDSTLGEAMSAIVQRMTRLENAVTIQSCVNESLVRIIRDDTHVQAVYDTVINSIVDVEGVQRELASDNAKLRAALGKLGDHVENYEKSMADLAKGGKLRIESRTKRGDRNADGQDIAGEKIEWGLDAYTVEESDIMAKRLAVVENQLSANGAIGVAIRRIGNDIEDLQAGMIERQEAEESLKRFMEESSSASGILKKKIQACKKIWEHTLDQIKFGCDKYAQKVLEAEEAAKEEALANGDEPEEEEEEEEEEEDDDTQRDMPQKNKDPEMIQLLHKLYEEAESCVAGSFVIRENVEETCEVLCPRLDQLTIIIDDIMELDKKIRFGEDDCNKKTKKKVAAISDEPEANEDEPEEVVVSLGDIMCIDREYRMQSVLHEVVRLSIPVIDEMVDKIGMRRRIEKIESSSVSQDVLDAIKESSKETAKLLKTKANKEDMQLALNKRVLKSDIAKLKQVVMARMDLTPDEHHVLNSIIDESAEMTDSVMGGSSIASLDSNQIGGMIKGDKGDRGDRGMDGSSGGISFMGGGGGGVSSKAVQEVSNRIELLLKHLQELQEKCNTFIPRDEVQEAMKAVLYEIKVIKMNTVNVNKFKEVTESKADKEEVQKLMGVLSGALSDMMGMNVSASAKARCLLCDKPVSSVSKRGEKPDEMRSPSPPRTRGNNQHGTDSIVEENSRPSTSQPRLASSSSTSRLPDASAEARIAQLAGKAGSAKAKIASEITILKGSLDLPAIDQPNSVDSRGRSGGDAYKARVRSSGGGGSRQ
jgi:hypothetical protein